MTWKEVLKAPALTLEEQKEIQELIRFQNLSQEEAERKIRRKVGKLGQRNQPTYDDYMRNYKSEIKEEIMVKQDIIKKDIDLMLPRGKQKVLKAEDKDYDRGLLVKLLKNGGYEMAYWAGKHEPYPVEVLVDGKSIKKDAKKVTMKFHPEMEKKRGEK
tara:strand:- start:483 stop:956 length:474 start_codon:yes stop_codon:yes gene_type:complete